MPGSPGSGVSTAPTVPSGGPTAGSVERIVDRDKPVEVLILYGVWQALVLASAASLWAWRKEPLV